MISGEDVKNKTDYSINVIDSAIGFILYLTKEKAIELANELDGIKYDLAVELSKKGVAFEKLSLKNLKIIRDNYISAVIKRCNENQSQHTLNNLEDFSETFVAKSKSLLDVSDSSFTTSNIAEKIDAFDIKSDFNEYIKTTGQNIITAKDCAMFSAKKNTRDDGRLLSKYDSFCVRSQNMLFNKYLDIFDLSEKIRTIIKIQDALCVASYIISAKNLFSDSAVKSFVSKNPRYTIFETLKDVNEIGRA